MTGYKFSRYQYKGKSLNINVILQISFVDLKAVARFFNWHYAPVRRSIIEALGNATIPFGKTRYVNSVPGASFSKNLKSSSDLKHGTDNGYQGDC